MIVCIYVLNVSDVAMCPKLLKYRNMYYKQTKIHWPPAQPQVTFFAAMQISATTKHKPNIGHVLRRDKNLSHIQTHRNILATGSATGHVLRRDANLSHIHQTNMSRTWWCLLIVWTTQAQIWRWYIRPCLYVMRCWNNLRSGMRGTQDNEVKSRGVSKELTQEGG